LVAVQPLWRLGAHPCHCQDFGRDLHMLHHSSLHRIFGEDLIRPRQTAQLRQLATYGGRAPLAAIQCPEG